MIAQRDSSVEQPTSLELEIELLRAKLRHGHTLICDRCGNSITLSSAMVADLGSHLLRTALGLGWHVGDATAHLLGAKHANHSQRDLCPPCHRLAPP